MKYGSGYLLEVKLGGSSSASGEVLEARVQALEQHLLTMFPNATCLESFAERAQYKIPQVDVGVLSATFAALESSEYTLCVLVKCHCSCPGVCQVLYLPASFAFRAQSILCASVILHSN